MAERRLVGSYPVIGIRPTIDGRRGALDVRGSLEEQTMNMAKSAAKLFEENLRYSNGEPVKVVIADTTIGRVGESAACADIAHKQHLLLHELLGAMREFPPEESAHHRPSKQFHLHLHSETQQKWRNVDQNSLQG